MKIVSRFRDYYDGAAAWDPEPKPVYYRITREARLAAAPRAPGGRERWSEWPGTEPDAGAAAALERLAPELRRISGTFVPDVFHPLVIGFCGQIRCAWRLGGHEVFHDAGEIEEIDDGPQVVPRSRRPVRIRTRITLDLQADFRRHAEAAGGVEVFRQLGVPAFTIESFGSEVAQARLLRDPPLGTLGFEAIFDANRAWQELDRFLTERLPRERGEPVPLSDEERRDAHGFGEESFRHRSRRR